MHLLQNIHGFLLLDKPLKLTSNEALQKVKKMFNAKKAGHTGILDPLATGMLPICFGNATKFSQFLLDANKQYEVVATLGGTTTTGDTEGEMITQQKVNITAQELQQVLLSFMGEISQIPPMYSAIKQNGVPLYKLARRGIEVERKPRRIRIFTLNLLRFTDTEIYLEVKCSKGTYIRTLVEDIGKALGCGAFVRALRRISVSPYEQYPMHTLTKLETQKNELGANVLLNHLLPIETALQTLPIITLSKAQVFSLRQGKKLPFASGIAGNVRIYLDNKLFLGVGEVKDGYLLSSCLINTV